MCAVWWFADGEIFAIDQTANAIVVFPTTASGNVAPIRRIAGPDTGLGTGLVSNAAVFGGEIYVPQSDGTISVFPQNADGDVAPTRVISGLGFITYLAISNGEIYVTGDHQIEVLPVDASGPVAPTRVIMGAATGLNFPTALLVNNNNLFVSDSAPGAIRVYARTASGNAAPLRVLTGAATRLVRPWQLGMYNGDLYVVDDSVAGISPPSAILVFAATATGNTAPKRMINGQLTVAGQRARPVHLPVSDRAARRRLRSAISCGSNTGTFRGAELADLQGTSARHRNVVEHVSSRSRATRPCPDRSPPRRTAAGSRPPPPRRLAR